MVISSAAQQLAATFARSAAERGWANSMPALVFPGSCQPSLGCASRT
jgi:hypothetical protein